MEKMFPDDWIIKTRHFDAGQDWETPIPAFFIIRAMKKIRSISEFTDDEATEFIKLVHMLRKGMKEILGIEKTMFFQNEGSEHTFHFWLFPRYGWMERFGTGSRSMMAIKEYAMENMSGEDNKGKVIEAVMKMREYMKPLKL